MTHRAATQTWHPAPETTAAAGDHIDGGEPRRAVSLLFHLGEMTATAEALAAARAAGVQVVDAVLRHLGGDWGDVDPATGAANDHAVAAGGTLQSLYPLAGIGDALVVTTDAERRHTIAALASQSEPDR